jgi:hypothetical protein
MLKKDFDKLKKELRNKNLFLPDIAKYQDNPIALEPFEKTINTFTFLNEQKTNDNLIMFIGIALFIGILIIV